MRSVHRLLGALMVLPLLMWAVTGAMIGSGNKGVGNEFILPPHEVSRSVTVVPDGIWVSARVVGTVLGDHLLLETDVGWRHVDPATGQSKPPPSERQLRTLLEDGFASNPERYGNIVDVSADSVLTDTGRRILVDWGSLTAVERGPDTDREALMVRLHKFALTGDSAFDSKLRLGAAAFVGLLCLFGLGLLVRGSEAS